MNWIRLLHDLKNVDHTQPHPIIAEYYLCFPKLQKLPSLKASGMFKIFNFLHLHSITCLPVHIPHRNQLQGKIGAILLQYKFLFYISFVLCLVLTVPFYPRKKKQKQKQKKRKSRERKRKKGPHVSTSLFAFSLLLSSQLMCDFFFFFCLLSLFTCI